VSDNLLAGDPNLDGCDGVTLTQAADGNTCTITTTRKALATDPNTLENTVTVTVLVDGTQQTITKTDTCSTKVLKPNFTVTKTCTSDPIPQGGPATFDVEICNTGNVALSFVTDENDQATPKQPYTVAAGQCQTIAIAIPTDGSVQVPNTINVTGTVILPEVCEGVVIAPISKGSNPAVCNTVGNEGCTPGFWKNSPNCWQCFAPTDKINNVFTIPSCIKLNPADTLLYALQKYPTTSCSPTKGDCLLQAAQLLFFQAVASLQNACSRDDDYNVHFSLTIDEIISGVNAALASCDRDTILQLKNTLGEFNQLGCPLASQNAKPINTCPRND
jgi:hypothetical protein